MLMASGGAMAVYASSQDALDEVVKTVSGLAWWVTTLENPDPDAGSAARTWCSTILTQPDINRNDPSEVVALSAIAVILAAVSVGGHA